MKMKVMIALPTWNKYIQTDIIDNFQEILSYTNSKGYECYGMRYERARIDFARNSSVYQAIKDDVDWLFFMDDDNPMDKDVVVRLIANGKDIVTGLVPRRSPPHVPCIFEFKKEWLNKDGIGFRPYPIEWVRKQDRLFEVDACGAACLLINKRVFTETHKVFNEDSFGYMKEGQTVNGKKIMVDVGEDIAFCRRAKKRGYKIWCDKSVRPGHIITAPYVHFDEDLEIKMMRR